MKRISIYTVEDAPIGSGGMGQVLKGYDPSGRPVAIKEIYPNFVQDYSLRIRIEQEIALLKRLNHPGIVKIYDNFELGNSMYIVMELIDGMNIEQYVQKNGAMSPNLTLQVLDKVLDIMLYVHNQGVVHRDIKPSNIMIRSNNEVCLLDFGVARDTKVGTVGTLAGTIIGTDGYMSPEQANGFALNHRSDIYSLGCVMFYMLTGNHAIKKVDNDFLMQKQIIEGTIPRISTYNVKDDYNLQEIIDKATDKNMLRRYANCYDFKSALEPIISNITIKPESSKTEKKSISVGRENCDITIGENNYKVSRHHADIEVKTFTGGDRYVFYDKSANGTMVNGKKLHNSYLSFNPGENPEIYLAGEKSCKLDWKKVEELLPMQKSEDDGGTIVDFFDSPISQPKSMRPVDAVKTCFKKYAEFKGRASRSEYWWFYAFNFSVMFLLYILMLVSGKPEFMAITSIYSLVVLLPGLAAAIRRLHDIDHSGKNLLWSFVPIVGGIYVFVLLLTSSTKGKNKYDY